jgi:alanine racemase
MAVVKSDAYGHGVGLVAPVLASRDVTHWGIASIGEGRQLRAVLGGASAKHDIYVMTAVLPENASDLVALGLTPYCSDFALAEALSSAAITAGTTATLHIEVDTGIGRAGVEPDDVAAFITAVRALPDVRITGICTHFTAADATDGPHDAHKQHAIFARVLSELDQKWLSSITVHASNSPGILRVNAARHQLIRPGLLLYGIGPSSQLAGGSELPFPYRPVMALKARALLVRKLPAGTDISYSRTYRLPSDATIATIGIGYGDGFPRRLSSKGFVLLPDGARAPMRGRVCMDQVCVELPTGSGVKAGDTVILIGTVGPNSITALEIADEIDATPHEIPTCLTARVTRILV